MKKYFNVKIFTLIISSLIPWPRPVNQSLSCSRERSFLVRNVILKKWMPIYDKFSVEMPLECPFHPTRDIYHPFHQEKIQTGSQQWTCSLCSKSFHTEFHLDNHLSTRHQDKLVLVEDSVCPSDFCDIIRCDVMQAIELLRSSNHSKENLSSKGGKPETVTALAKVAPRDLIPLHRFGYNVYHCVDEEQTRQKGWLMLPSQLPQTDCGHLFAKKVVHSSNETNQEDCVQKNQSYSKLNSTTVFPIDEVVFSNMKQQQSSCTEDDFIPHRTKCARLIHSCSAGLILQMTNQQFIHFQGELNRAICWHLTCDRYWQEIWSSSRSPYVTAIVFGIAMLLLSLGLTISYCIVCVICDDRCMTNYSSCFDLADKGHFKSENGCEWLGKADAGQGSCERDGSPSWTGEEEFYDDCLISGNKYQKVEDDGADDEEENSIV